MSNVQPAATGPSTGAAAPAPVTIADLEAEITARRDRLAQTIDELAERVRPSSIELGFWRPQPDGEIEFMLAHPTGIVEMYYGTKDPEKPIVNLRTDGVLRSATSKEYSAATRLYGLVDSQLMWVMDMAAMGVELTSHVSAQLKRVE